MKLLLKLLLFISLCFCTNFLAQDLVAEKGSFGVDTKHKIIVWHIPNLDSVKIDYKNIIATYNKGTN